MTEKKDEVEQKLSFQAEVSRLLDIVANSLYSEREIFLRELISNAADACEKLRYLSISNEKLLEKDKDFKINIILSKKTNLISIEDNGLGMSKEELIDNLGTIARSGTSKFLENIKEEPTEETNTAIEDTQKIYVKAKMRQRFSRNFVKHPRQFPSIHHFVTYLKQIFPYYPFHYSLILVYILNIYLFLYHDLLY